MTFIDTIQKNIRNYFKVNNNCQTVVISLILTFFVCFISYSAFIVYGFVCPDGLLEGMHFYIAQGWAIAGCGRWFLVLLNILHMNMVFPWLAIVECMFVNWLSAHTICKIFEIKNKWCYFSVCVLFAVLPTFIEMYLYTNSAFSYCLSVFFSVLFVYLNLFNNKKLFLISGILLGCAMGSYQSQVGVAVGVTVMCIIKKILEDDKNTVSFCIISLLSGIFGLIVYIIGLKFFLKVYGLVLFSRAASFSISSMISNFPSRFIEMYRVFINTFNQATIKRWVIYLILLIIFVVEIIFVIVYLYKKKRHKSIILVVLLVLLLPPSINIIGILLPEYDLAPLMLTPNYFIIPFIIYLSKFVTNKLNTILTFILVLSLLANTWTYVLSANATYDGYRLAYDYYENQFSSAINRVFDLDEYQPNSTKIVVIGRPNDKVIRKNIKIYDYAIGLYDNLLYWETTELDPSTTNKYIIQEFGIDPGELDYEEYVAFINLDECTNMPCWPSKDSVKIVNGCAVIKFSEAYE